MHITIRHSAIRIKTGAIGGGLGPKLLAPPEQPRPVAAGRRGVDRASTVSQDGIVVRRVHG